MLLRSFTFAAVSVAGLHAVALWAAWQRLAPIPEPVIPPPLPVTLQIAPVVASTVPVAEPPIATPKKSVLTPSPRPSKSPQLTQATPAPESTLSAVETVAAVSEPSPPIEPAPAPSPPPELYAADYLNNPAPDYPKLSQKYREEGVVEVRVFVTPEGLAEQVEVAHSSGFSRLDRAALAAVKQWRFIPQRQDTTLISSWVVVPVRFDLKKKESVRG